jgi:competence protein ComEA
VTTSYPTTGASSRTQVGAAVIAAPRRRQLRPFVALLVLAAAALLTVLVTTRLDAPRMVALENAAGSGESASALSEMAQIEQLPSAGSATDTGTDDAISGQTDPALSPVVVVHVTGAVQQPGIVELPVGARVSDAVAAAGGPSDDAAMQSVNLARRVNDGEQLVLVVPGAPPDPALGSVPLPPPGTEATTTGAPTGVATEVVINLNTANAEQLQQLPRVGPATAAKILDHRQRQGPFTSVDQLLDVPGIGERTLAGLRDLVRI